MCAMNAHAVKVSCFGYRNQTNDDYFADSAFSNETALFHLSNGATMRICEHRDIGLPGRETFRIYGTKGSFEDDSWADKHKHTPVTLQEMRDPLPDEVAKAFAAAFPGKDFLGGHGGSHAYLAHEFVDAIAHGRTPAINAWEAARYVAAGAVAHKSALKDGERLKIPSFDPAPGKS
jgi:predicted dehydrogenase